MCNAAVNWYGREPGATIERIADEFVRLILDGLAPRPVRRRRRA
jgi:hypothetical protein